MGWTNLSKLNVIDPLHPSSFDRYHEIISNNKMLFGTVTKLSFEKRRAYMNEWKNAI